MPVARDVPFLASERGETHGEVAQLRIDDDG